MERAREVRLIAHAGLCSQDCVLFLARPGGACCTRACSKPVMLPAALCTVGITSCACTSACPWACCLFLHDWAYTHMLDGFCVALQLNINVTNKDAKLRSQEDE